MTSGVPEAPAGPAETASPRAVAEFFDATWSAFEQAESRNGPDTYEQHIGPVKLRLRFAGRALATNLLPAIAGLADATHESDCEIAFWDARSSGVAIPNPPWRTGDYDDHASLRQTPASGILAAINVEGRVIQLYAPGSRRAIWCVPDLDRMASHERGAPCRLIYSWLLPARGLHAIHAGAIGTPNGVVLLAGRGGTGKSTLAIGSLLHSGLRYLSDDYCVISAGDTPMAHALYRTGKILEGDLARWPSLQPAADPRVKVGDKAVFFVGRDLPDRVLTSAPIRAVVLPRVRADVATALRPASAREATLGLSLSTTSQAPTSTDTVVGAIASIARRVPAFHLDIRAGDTAGPALLESWLNASV
jgi:hypothetical protein